MKVLSLAGGRVTHLAESQVPLTEGQKVWPLCGKEIHDSVWMFQWLPGEVNDDALNSLNTCSKCRKVIAAANNDGEHTYMYGVQSRSEKFDGQFEQSIHDAVDRVVDK